MASIPSYSEWMRDTRSALHKRSDALKDLDAAIKRFDGDKSDRTRKSVKNALFQWKRDQVSKKRGQDWTKSVRNNKGAVTNLDRALDDIAKRNLSPEEAEALMYIARIQSKALADQFKEAKVAFKANTLMGMKNTAQTKYKEFKANRDGVIAKASGGGRPVGASRDAKTFVKSGLKSAKEVKGMAKGVKENVKSIHEFRQAGGSSMKAAAVKELETKILGMLKKLCPNTNPTKVFSTLGLPSPGVMAADLAPFLGALTSGKDAILAWKKVISLQVEQMKTEKNRHAFAPQDPEAAFDAVLLLLDREINAQAARATVKTGAFAGKLAGSFVDLGAATAPAIGLAETLATVFQTVIEYARDIREADVANEYIRLGNLNMDIFQACPILGCYFLVVQDHSTIINFAVGDYGSKNFVLDAERLVAKINPVLDKSRQYIHASRLEVPGCIDAKGVVQQHWSLKGPLGKTGKNQVKPTGVRIRNKGEEISGSITDRIREWRKKPVKPAKVDLKRIAGVGHNGHTAV